MTLGGLGGAVQPLTRKEVVELARRNVTTGALMTGRALGVSEPKIREMARSGELQKLGIRVLRVGIQYRIPTQDILDALGISRDMETAASAPPDAADLTSLRPSAKGPHEDDTPAA